MKNKRIVYAVITAFLLAIEVLIALFVHDNFIRPYVGDIIVVMVIYAFIRIIIPERVRLLPGYILCFAVLVEVLQYFRIVEVLGLSDNRFFSVLIGSVFDVKDIICYAIGCVLIIVGQAVYKLCRKAKEQGEE